MILHAGGARRLGVRTPENLASDLQEEVVKQAEVYGIAIDFIPRRSRSLGQLNGARRRVAARRAIASDAAKGKEDSENAD